MQPSSPLAAEQHTSSTATSHLHQHASPQTAAFGSVAAAAEQQAPAAAAAGWNMAAAAADPVQPPSFRLLQLSSSMPTAERSVQPPSLNMLQPSSSMPAEAQQQAQPAASPAGSAGEELSFRLDPAFSAPAESCAEAPAKAAADEVRTWLPLLPVSLLLIGPDHLTTVLSVLFFRPGPASAPLLRVQLSQRYRAAAAVTCT